MKKIFFLSILISFLSCKKGEDNVPKALEEKVTTAKLFKVFFKKMKVL